MVFPAPEGAERTKRTPVRRKVLFNVRELLAQLVQFGFCFYDEAGDIRIVRLGTGCVPLAAHFLGQKLQRAPDGGVALEILAQLDEVAVQPGQFLGDVAAFREDGNLRGEPRVEYVQGQPCGLEAAL